MKDNLNKLVLKAIDSLESANGALDSDFVMRKCQCSRGESYTVIDELERRGYITPMEDPWWYRVIKK